VEDIDDALRSLAKILIVNIGRKLFLRGLRAIAIVCGNVLRCLAPLPSFSCSLVAAILQLRKLNLYFEHDGDEPLEFSTGGEFSEALAEGLSGSPR